jgi:hypothetical protein
MADAEFYVGYLERAPLRVAAAVRRAAILLLVAGTLTAAAVVTAHARRPGAGFEFGTAREFVGRLREHPCPLLEVERPGAVDGFPATSSYPLVREGKHGAGDLVAGLDGRRVRLTGTIAYRDAQAVIEIADGSLRVLADDGAPAPAAEALGRFTLRGEIVDSKCFFGVMNPGELKPHRACAARCISGGIPPVLCVKDREGHATYLVLVAPDGAPVNTRVLDYIAEPVEIEGEVQRQGDVFVLRSDPSTYRRL